MMSLTIQVCLEMKLRSVAAHFTLVARPLIAQVGLLCLFYEMLRIFFRRRMSATGLEKEDRQA